MKSSPLFFIFSLFWCFVFVFVYGLALWSPFQELWGVLVTWFLVFRVSKGGLNVWVVFGFRFWGLFLDVGIFVYIGIYLLSFFYPPSRGIYFGVFL